MLGSTQGFHFTILENPTNAFDLLIGRNTTLFTYTLPTLSLSTNYDIDIPTPIPLVSVHFSGTLAVSVSATFGADASGLLGGNFQDGFVLEGASVMVEMSLAAGPGIGIPDGVELSVDGGLGVSATFTLTGTDGNPSVTGAQLANGQFSIVAASDVQGSLSIDITALGEDVYSYTLAAFDYPLF